MVLFPGHAEHSPSAERERCAEVRDVFVPEPHRRKGVASALMEALEEAALRNGHDRVGLSVALDDQAAPARGLYEALGYTRAHGPFVSSTTLEGDDGPVPVGAVLVYLTKPL
jgi:GNAT superfamily N-acetyltransferase